MKSTKNKKGKKKMLKLISWNIDSLNAALTSESARALLSMEVLSKIAAENADIIAIQETKLPQNGPSKKHLEEIEKYFTDYKVEWVSSTPPARKGYAGTMVLYKNNLEAKRSIPVLNAPDTMDSEGRLITLEFKDFFFVNVYTPNAGDGLKRLADRQKWDELYGDYLKSLDEKKYVIACGDFNVAHEEIDLANPQSNHMSAGFTDEERAGFTKILSKGFVDTFRYVNKDVKGAYSWWSQRIKTSKVNNAGWRIDYFLVSDRVKDKVNKSCMMDSGERQDHAPIMIEIEL